MIIVERNGTITGVYSGDWEITNDTLVVNGGPVLHPASLFGIHEIPDQDLSGLYQEDALGNTVIAGKWPGDVPLRYTDTELRTREAQYIDRDTGKAIDEAMHPFAGMEEQIAILRAQIAEILNSIGLAPTDDFDRLNTIAAEKIQEGQKKKEAL